MNQRIIAITGNRGAGKSYLAQRWAEESLRSVEILPFAAGLKEGLRAMFPWLTDAQLYGSKKEVIDPRLGTTPRRAMQTLGAEWARNRLDPEIWLRRWAYVAEQSEADVLLVDDVRYENEARFIEESGLDVLFVHCEGGQSPTGHSSEGFGPVAQSIIVPPRGGLTYLTTVYPELVL